ncbi:conserved domain-containing [Fusarium longipes]|uniref:Conserved domain-containing n=1 Tax=Fusarium longipes TaxID=694270 RepID=A0A395SR96_9HYPO|nr:conserved domain-containing [Fusarium longipes]
MSIKPNSTSLVDLGSYKLEVTLYGPPRRAHNPVVVITPDIGSSIKEWTVVTRMLAESMAVLNYERAGYGKSEPAPAGEPRTPAALALELHTLLRAAKIAPPYIMVCHSRSASVLGEFTMLRNMAQFKGFVFVDAKTGLSDPLLEARLSRIDSLKLCYGDCHRLGGSAWQALLDEMARTEHKEAAEREIIEYPTGGFTSLFSVEQPEYGRVPLVVLQADVGVDFRKVYDELDDGTKAQVDDVGESNESGPEEGYSWQHQKELQMR